MVSVYSTYQGVVLATQQFKSNQTNELKVLQTMLKTLHLDGVVFSMDALHCQKTTELIVEGANDYIITVKSNQPRLLLMRALSSGHLLQYAIGSTLNLESL